MHKGGEGEGGIRDRTIEGVVLVGGKRGKGLIPWCVVREERER